MGHSIETATFCPYQIKSSYFFNSPVRYYFSIKLTKRHDIQLFLAEEEFFSSRKTFHNAVNLTPFMLSLKSSACLRLVSVRVQSEKITCF